MAVAVLLAWQATRSFPERQPLTVTVPAVDDGEPVDVPIDGEAFAALAHLTFFMADGPCTSPTW